MRNARSDAAAFVGVGLGLPVGRGDGLEEGLLVGNLVGEAVGKFVNPLLVGCQVVGLTDGRAVVGLLVIINVGRLVVTTVGARVT